MNTQTTFYKCQNNFVFLIFKNEILAIIYNIVKYNNQFQGKLILFISLLFYYLQVQVISILNINIFCNNSILSFAKTTSTLFTGIVYTGHIKNA